MEPRTNLAALAVSLLTLWPQTYPDRKYFHYPNGRAIGVIKACCLDLARREQDLKSAGHALLSRLLDTENGPQPPVRDAGRFRRTFRSPVRGRARCSGRLARRRAADQIRLTPSLRACSDTALMTAGA